MRHKPYEKHGSMKYWKSRHDLSLDKLLERPKLLGITEPVIWSTKEMHIYRPDGLGLITDIDLVYRTGQGLYLAEYKSSDSQRQKAVHQLHAAERFIQSTFNERPYLIYVHGENFKWEKIPRYNDCH